MNWNKLILESAIKNHEVYCMNNGIEQDRDLELKKIMFKFAAAMYQMGQEFPDDGELQEKDIDLSIWIDDFKKAVKR